MNLKTQIGVAFLLLSLTVISSAQIGIGMGRRNPRAAAPSKVPAVKQIDSTGLRKALTPSRKPLLVNFWATWCDPCREEFPDLVRLDADYKDKPLNFVAVSLDDITDIKSEVPKF